MAHGRELLPGESRAKGWDERIEAERQAAVAAERQRFAQDLHDVVAAHLQAALLQIDVGRQLLPAQGSDGVAAALVEAQRYVRACWADARRCAAALRPAELERLGLSAALTDFIARLDRASPATRLDFHVAGELRDLPPAVEASILRIAQEAVTNALRHAEARTVRVQLDLGPEAVRLTVADDGRGFDPRRPTSGQGVRGLRDRAERAGALLSIQSRPGLGTQVTMTVPCPDHGTTYGSGLPAKYLALTSG